MPPNRITAILNETRGITGDTALRLARVLGCTAEFWMNLQATYDFKAAALEGAREIDKLASIKPIVRKTA